MGGFLGGPWFGGGPAGVEEVVHGWTVVAASGLERVCGQRSHIIK